MQSCVECHKVTAVDDEYYLTGGGAILGVGALALPTSSRF
jgi:hypothetical protein